MAAAGGDAAAGAQAEAEARARAAKDRELRAEAAEAEAAEFRETRSSWRVKLARAGRRPYRRRRLSIHATREFEDPAEEVARDVRRTRRIRHARTWRRRLDLPGRRHIGGGGGGASPAAEPSRGGNHGARARWRGAMAEAAAAAARLAEARAPSAPRRLWASGYDSRRRVWSFLRLRRNARRARARATQGRDRLRRTRRRRRQPSPSELSGSRPRRARRSDAPTSTRLARAQAACGRRPHRCGRVDASAARGCDARRMRCGAAPKCGRPRRRPRSPQTAGAVHERQRGVAAAASGRPTWSSRNGCRDSAAHRPVLRHPR